jgi:dihydrofolate reductase
LIQGSSVLVKDLLAADLIDELHLIQIPIVLGKGKRFFGEGSAPAAMKLTGHKATSTGVVISSYLRDGAVQTGTFEYDTPSDAELARREKLKREG